MSSPNANERTRSSRHFYLKRGWGVIFRTNFQHCKEAIVSQSSDQLLQDIYIQEQKTVGEEIRGLDFRLLLYASVSTRLM